VGVRERLDDWFLRAKTIVGANLNMTTLNRRFSFALISFKCQLPAAFKTADKYAPASAPTASASDLSLMFPRQTINASIKRLHRPAKA